MPWLLKTIADLFERVVLLARDQDVLLVTSSGEETSWDETTSAMSVLARWHQKLPVLPAPARAVWWGYNHPAIAALHSLCLSYGISLIPLPAGAPPETIQAMIAAVDATMIAVDSEHERILHACRVAPQNCVVANWEEENTTTATLRWPHQSPGKKILFTSGTSGQPRAVCRSPQNDRFRIRQIIDLFHLKTEFCHLVAGPLYHSGPAIFLHAHRHLGSEIIMLPRFVAATVARYVLNGKVDTLFLVPTQWRKLLAVTDLRHLPLKRAWIAGSAASPDLLAHLLRVLPNGALFEFYGSTETGTVTVIDDQAMASHPGSVGQPVPEVRLSLVDQNGTPTATGEEGKIYIESPMVMTGYLDGSEVDSLPDGSLSVGDRGFMDSDGYLYLAGREGDMMISGGVNVYPTEVENAALQHPDVDDAIAFAIPDPLWGDRIELAIVTQNGNHFESDGVIEYLKGHLAPAATPKKIHRMDQLPRTPAGKPDRQQTRRRLYGNL